MPNTEHYFLAIAGIDGTDVEVTREQWVRAERQAGFRPKGVDRGQPATGGFSGHGIRGYTRSGPAETPYRAINGKLLAAALNEGFGLHASPPGDKLDDCGDQDVPVALMELVAEHIEEGLDGCDHSVGVCECSARATLQELQLWLAGRRWCPECGGEGIGDMRVDTVVDPDTGDVYDDHITYPCQFCDGKGTLPIEYPTEPPVAPHVMEYFRETRADKP